MFGRRFEIFRVLGVPVRADFSWFLIVVLVIWSLAVSYFPFFQPGLDASVYWAMGVAGALGLFGSVIVHELAHAMVARRYGLSIRGITLFLFGGVAEMDSEPPNAAAEFAVAIAGPVASLAVALVFLLLSLSGSSGGWPAAFNGVAWCLTFINGSLMLFNMVPAFPLDGGRILRSALWQWRGDLRWATRVSSAAGSGFGMLLLVYGVFRVLIGQDFVGGIWMLLIGMFLRNAAQMSYRQLVLRSGLEGRTVESFVQADPVTVPRSLSVAELVERYIYRYHHRLLPVVDHQRLIGCVTTEAVKALPREEWERQSVGSITQPSSPENTIGVEAPASEALARMNRGGSTRLMVVSGEDLVGVVTLKDLLQFLALKVELEGEKP